MKSDFLSIAYHEMGTKLALIREGIAIVLGKMAGPINKKQQNFLNIAERNVDKLTKLINNVYTFQELASGKIKFDMRENDISEIVKEVQRTTAPLAEKKELDFVVRLDDGLPGAVFDSSLIARVITNITGNAIKFTEKGSIEIAAGHKNGSIHVSIQDTGCGVRKEALPLLFREFENIGKGSAAKTSTTGLELAISRKIIEAHGGKILAESEFGKGTTIKFTLPVEPRGLKSAGLHGSPVS
ncbi:MAG: HAMP domain-containing sensor histidine kinase [Candidatus Omnitrophota bacterium]|nr:HAMP domain-containing sensor histidine kinase [Candidatus Omnitrophota bacterium]